MMVNDDDDADKAVSDDAVEELLDADTEDEEDEIDPEAKETLDEFGAGIDDDAKARDWE